MRHWYQDLVLDQGVGSLSHFSSQGLICIKAVAGFLQHIRDRNMEVRG